MADEKTEPKAEKIVSRVIEQEMKASYLDYSMSVIVGRALPDVRDGLKPVHRRALYAMYDLGMFHNKPFKKSARIVGEILGKYHPHGDMAVYDAMVRLAQDFSLRYPLIDGQGNWGSVDGDRAAAMRYCVTGDTLIATEKGLVDIGALSKDENINIKILSKDKKINTASKWFDSGSHPALKLVTNKGFTLTGSYNHPILTLTTDETGKPKFAWKLLEQISAGDIVVLDRSSEVLWPEEEIPLKNYYPVRNPYLKPRVLPSSLCENLGFILGALLAEGSISTNKIEFCNTDEQFIKAFEDAWHKIFPDSTLHKFKKKPSSYGKKEYMRLECHCRYTVRFLHALGLAPVRAKYKTLPVVILQSPKSVVAAFLRGYFEGDGSISYALKKSNSLNMVELSCCSVSSSLLEQMQILLLRFGIDATRRFDKYRLTHKLYLRGARNLLRFYKQIGFLSDFKSQKLEYVLVHYKKDSSSYDYVPFISDFIRGAVDSSTFIERHNFDRYGSMKQNYQSICAEVLQKTGQNYVSLFEYLLTCDYVFEKVMSIEQAGLRQVFSIRVDSQCHSFIGNGFINHNTEARLKKLAEEILQDIDKETVEFIPNFDASLQEPSVLPSKVPNLLVNGSSGIAVGMATNIPPHNMSEVCDGIMKTIDNPEIDVLTLMQTIKAPDFPTGGQIMGLSGLKEAYKTGRGRIIVRAKTHIEEAKNKTRIIVSEIPYMVNKSEMIEAIADLVRDKKIQGISDLRDESDREGMRIVIDLKSGANSDVVLNQLFAHSRLQETFGINLLALVDNRPKLLSLKDIIQNFIDYRRQIVRRRTQFDLRQAEDRAHLLEGLIVALDNIDAVVKLIKQAKSADEAKAALMADYKLSEKQAQAILDMTLRRLTSLEQNKIRTEHDDLLILVKELKDILASEQKILGLIKAELLELKERYGDARRTQVLESEVEVIEEESLIKPEDDVITITHAGYVKRLPVDTYKQQRRGGKGIIAAEAKEEDFIENLFVANTHDYFLFFTNFGKVHWIKVYQIPEAGRYAKGTAIVNLLQLGEKEKVTAFIPVKQFEEDKYLFMVTLNGTVKKTSLAEFSNPRKGGIIALGLDEKDELKSVMLTDGDQQIIIATKQGMAVKFHESDVRAMGRTATGVIGIRLRDDVVVGATIADDKRTLVTVTEKGHGKRTPISDYRLISRGGVGVINIKITDKNGSVVGIASVIDEDELMLISQSGVLIRTPVKGISVIGRNTQGVRVMKLEENDKVISLAKIIPEE